MSERSPYASTRPWTAASSTFSTTSTRSLTPQVFTDMPKRISASTLSPSVTATLRMLSPNRASFRPRAAAAPAAARAQEPTRACTRGLPTCPATVVRGVRSRVSMKPYSRSPCAAWFRFMKSMSIVAHGRAASAWVCRCNSGLRSASRPVIHIFAGEKVCIQVITPRQFGSSLASPIARRIAPASVRTGFQTTRTGTFPAWSSVAATRWDCSATCWRGSSPLAIDVLVPRVQRVDVRLRDRDGLTQLAGEVHGAGDVLGHDRGLDRGLGRGPDGEDAVVLHENGGRPGRGQRRDDALADGVVADEREGPDRDGTAE